MSAALLLAATIYLLSAVIVGIVLRCAYRAPAWPILMLVGFGLACLGWPVTVALLAWYGRPVGETD